MSSELPMGNKRRAVPLWEFNCNFRDSKEFRRVFTGRKLKANPVNSNENLVKFSRVAEESARVGGKLLSDFLGRAKVSEKSPGDLVTEADLASQAAIKAVIESYFPTHLFLGEEDDGSLNSLPDGEHFCWVVDPLDGTKNYAHQLPGFSVSVALVHVDPETGDNVLVGAVYDPLLDEMFSAIKGGGATLNKTPIIVNQCESLKKSFLVCSFSSNLSANAPEIQRFLRVVEKAGSFRRLGSAALNFCYVGCGRVDGYWATSIKIWDVAAGLLIVNEAGGIITGLNGETFDMRSPKFLASCGESLHGQLLPLLGD